MKKYYIYLMIALIPIALIACNSEETEEANNNTQSEENTEEVNDIEPLGDYDFDQAPDDAIIINEAIVDNDYIFAVITYARHATGAGVMSEGENQVQIYVENKTDKNLHLAIEDVYIDQVELDDFEFGILLTDEDKTDIGTLRTFDYDGDLPEIKDNIAFELLLTDDNTLEDIETYEIDITF